MRFALIGFVFVYGLIHLMGFAKAFRLAELPSITQPISRAVGLAWLATALLFGLTGVMLLLVRDRWWQAALLAVLFSQSLVILSWPDAKYGTLVNLIIAASLISPALESRPGSFRNQYRAAVRESLGGCDPMPSVTEADLANLPEPVQRYLRHVGAVGKPRIQDFQAVFTGNFRTSPEGRWMRFRSKKVNVVNPPSRLFLMKASLFGVPLEGLHMFQRDGATMRIQVASLFRAVDARGPKMDRSETVTLFNDLCLMAPAALIDDRRIRWGSVGPLSARAAFTHQGNTVTAELTINEVGQLIDFVSPDRYMSADGKTYLNLPWSTPARGYRDFGGRKVPTYFETVWHTPDGLFVYGRFHLVEIAYNLNALE